MNATVRAHHRSRKTYALGAVALAALLASTACDPNTAAAPGGGQPSGRPGATGAATPGGSGSATPGGPGSPKPSGSPGAVAATCAEDCTVHSYPTVRLGADARTPGGVIEDSDPKALLTLASGRQAHAALLVSGGHMDEYQALTLTVALRGPAPGDKPGEPLPVALPGVDRLWADYGARVTYWSTASGFALRFIMSS
ncbi:DUF4232 domain-containing protein [Streptomyces sp. NPDC101733]|uniref:DUF4232 domain-containing protein n=1 Tax=unclassified Streptomyces TaxID=2593676 RepID=UPI00380C1760